MAVQWLALSTSTAGDSGLIPTQGAKILHAGSGAKKKKSLETRTSNRGSEKNGTRDKLDQVEEKPERSGAWGTLGNFLERRSLESI